MLSFHEWLHKQYGQSWDDLVNEVNLYELIQYTFDYEFYCHSKGIEPSWS